MNFAAKIFSKTYTVAISLLGLIVLAPLAILNAYNTCFINKREHVQFTKDYVFLNLFVVIVLLVLMFLARKNKYVQSFVKRVNTDEVFYKKCRNTLLIVIFAIGAVWVLATQPNPGADQRYVQEAVLALKKHDFSAFEKGGYVSEYPNQIGIIVISYFFSLIFGDLNYVAIQLVNAVGVALFYKVVTDIQKEFGLGRIERVITAATGVMFLPLILYANFVYGTVMGLLFSVLAFKYEILFFKKYKLKDIFLCALFIAIAIMLKNNYLIAFVAVLIFAVVELVSNRKFRYVWSLGLLIFMFMAQSLIPRTVLEGVTGEELDKGSSSWSWIAMGLQECSLAQGWYNGFNAGSYLRAEYDPEVQAVEAKEQIESRLDEFMEDKEYAASFFGHKIASMWSEPTYQSIWITQIRSTDIQQSELVFKALSEDGSQPLAIFLNYFQFVIYFGSVLYLFMCRNREFYRQSLIFLVVFMGGFIFHIAWEAKGQYSISYFVLLIPYAVAGLLQTSKTLGAKVNALIESIKDKKKPNLESIWEVSTLSFVMFLIVFVFTGLFVICGLRTGWEPLREDTEEYKEYIENEKLLNGYNVNDGKYYIKNMETGMYLAKQPETDGYSSGLVISQTPQEVEIRTRKGVSYLSFVDGDRYLDDYDTGDLTHQNVDTRGFSGSIGQSWQVVPVKGVTNGYSIVHDKEYALIYNKDTNTFYVTLNSKSAAQIWIFEEVK